MTLPKCLFHSRGRPLPLFISIQLNHNFAGYASSSTQSSKAPICFGLAAWAKRKWNGATEGERVYNVQQCVQKRYPCHRSLQYRYIYESVQYKYVWWYIRTYRSIPTIRYKVYHGSRIVVSLPPIWQKIRNIYFLKGVWFSRRAVLIILLAISPITSYGAVGYLNHTNT